MRVLPDLERQGGEEKYRRSEDEPARIMLLPKPGESDQRNREQPTEEKPPVRARLFENVNEQRGGTHVRVDGQFPGVKVAQSRMMVHRFGTRVLPDEQRRSRHGLAIKNIRHYQGMASDAVEIVEHPKARGSQDQQGGPQSACTCDLPESDSRQRQCEYQALERT